mgnify:CR=1 FL=1
MEKREVTLLPVSVLSKVLYGAFTTGKVGQSPLTHVIWVNFRGCQRASACVCVCVFGSVYCVRVNVNVFVSGGKITRKMSLCSRRLRAAGCIALHQARILYWTNKILRAVCHHFRLMESVKMVGSPLGHSGALSVQRTKPSANSSSNICSDETGESN